jgi:hypothetical protein
MKRTSSLGGMAREGPHLPEDPGEAAVPDEGGDRPQDCQGRPHRRPEGRALGVALPDGRRVTRLPGARPRDGPAPVHPPDALHGRPHGCPPERINPGRGHGRRFRGGQRRHSREEAGSGAADHPRVPLSPFLAPAGPGRARVTGKGPQSRDGWSTGGVGRRAEQRGRNVRR